MKKGGKILFEIYIKAVNKEIIPAEGVVSVPAPGATVEAFKGDIEKNIKKRINEYTGQGYEPTKNDCLVFTLEILNGVFNSGIRLPRKAGKGKKPTPAEDYDTWYQGFKEKK